MKNITETMLCFRDAAAHVWNAYLRTTDDPMSVDVQLSRDRIELELLRAIVLYNLKIDLDIENYRHNHIQEIVICHRDGIHDLPVLIGEAHDNGNTTWSKSLIGSDGFPILAFKEFFDWNSYGHVTMGLVIVVSIDDGRMYMIEEMHCDFFAAANSVECGAD
ncbi:MAG: hypothetical protein V4564_08490 [Pseudomonadota bacterium]